MLTNKIDNKIDNTKLKILHAVLDGFIFVLQPTRTRNCNDQRDSTVKVAYIVTRYQEIVNICNQKKEAYSWHG